MNTKNTRTKKLSLSLSISNLMSITILCNFFEFLIFDYFTDGLCKVLGRQICNHNINKVCFKCQIKPTEWKRECMTKDTKHTPERGWLPKTRTLAPFPFQLLAWSVVGKGQVQLLFIWRRQSITKKRHFYESDTDLLCLDGYVVTDKYSYPTPNRFTTYPSLFKWPNTC